MEFMMNLSYAFITMIGILFGHLFRCEHSIKPLNTTVITAWPILSIYGLIFTNMISVFYFMTMVTIGWFACEYTCLLYTSPSQRDRG